MRSLKNAGIWRRVREFGSLCLVLGIILAIGGSRAAEEGSAPGTLRVEVVNHLLSVAVGDAAVEEVLREVARQAGFALEVRGDLGQVRAQAFEVVPIDQGIQRLVSDNRVNLMMRYEVETGERRLVEVTARAAGEAPPELLEERRMRAGIARIRVPPPPPPPGQ